MINGLAFIAMMSLPFAFAGALIALGTGVQLSRETRRWRPVLLGALVCSAAFVMSISDPGIIAWLAD
ncbi:MAG: hypothetical protein H7Y88_01840 [Phycisphaerales bacterium]|nr:hypothetical protein [Phycisphaerales bacterium]